MILSQVKEKYKYTDKLKDYYDKFVIYKLTFSNKKIYIGQTKNLKRRLYSYLNKNNNNNHFVKKAIIKHGLSNVDIEIIKICDNITNLNESEIFYISFYNSTKSEKGYNLSLGGNNFGVCNQTVLKKINSSKKIKVAQYDLNGDLINIYNSVKEASRILKIQDTDIHRCCKNKGSRNGYLFSKTIFNKIEPINYKKQTGKWNLKKYKIINIITSDIIIIEGLKNVSEYLNCTKKYLNNIIARKTIYNKQFKVEKYEG